MPIQIRAAKTNKNEEKKILIASIVSTQFLKETPFLRPEIFVITYAKRVFKWVDSYFKKYDEAPQKTIKDIFNAERNKIDEDEAELIADFLESISSQYANEEDKEIFNSKYAIDNARKYAKQRELELKISEVNGLLSMGNIEEAESSLLNYKKAAFNTSSWINPFSKEEIHKIFENDNSNKLFRFPGDVGNLIGWTERGTVTCVQARYKLGKSFAIFESAYQALLQGLNVVIFSLEMTKNQSMDRIYKRITAATTEGGLHLYPISDCVKNQNGSCKKPERKNKITLYSHQDYIPEFDKADQNYRVCSCCKGTQDYEFASWFENIYRDELTPNLVQKRAKGFTKMFGDNLRIKIYPKFSASISDIERDLNFLEDTENFVADLIVLDYASLLRGNPNDKEERFRVGNIFKMLGGLVSSRNCALWTAGQSNRVGSKKQRAEATDMAESFEVTGHVDKLIILNQSDVEKRRGICRVGIGAMRDGAFESDNEAIILQDLSSGQWVLDSFYKE